MNKIILCGRLTKDVELSYAKTNQNMAIAKYSIAVDEYINEKKKAQFFNIVSFGKTGEFANKYFSKGQRVLIEGRVQQGEYTNKEGQKVKTLYIIASNQEFADGIKGSAKNAQTESIQNDIPDAMPDDDELPFK